MFPKIKTIYSCSWAKNLSENICAKTKTSFFKKMAPNLIRHNSASQGNNKHQRHKTVFWANIQSLNRIQLALAKGKNSG